MEKLRLYFQNHSSLYKGIFYICIILIGCFSFPFSFRNSSSLINYPKVYLLIVGYGVISLGFLAIFGEGKEKFVYILSMILTGIGLVCRYFLEYGEVSNIRNFTLINIITFLVIMPIYTTFIYKYILKYLIKEE